MPGIVGGRGWGTFTAGAIALMLTGACQDDDKTGKTDVVEDTRGGVGFGHPCTDNSQCESNRCVPHIGGKVCSDLCDADDPCPTGWSCWLDPIQPDGTTAPSFCVSQYWALCRPCAEASDCSALDGAAGLCLDYNGQGSFCGTGCQSDEDCPDDYQCATMRTLAGESVNACTSDGGICPCNPYIQGLGIPTLCRSENVFGTCHGDRECGGKVWSSCNAPTPALDYPNGIDDDCDGETDELSCACGDGNCDGLCGEDVDSCPCDCAVIGDGVCSPCGENPSNSPLDCCRSPTGSAGCGDGFCLGFGCGENPDTCGADCGTPCGDGICQPGENPGNCAEDCLHKVCGNNICEGPDGGPDECPQDCAAFCGDCECQPELGEVLFNCPIDCGFCGDGVCSACSILNENPATCAADCCEPSREICNGVDDDCDGEIDEAGALGCQNFYVDGDKDGLGDSLDSACLCAWAHPYTVPVPGDCDDEDEDVGLGTEEVCNGEDDDCDGRTDEDFGVGDPCDHEDGPCWAGVLACDTLSTTRCDRDGAKPRGTACGERRCDGGVIRGPSICDGDGGCEELVSEHCDGFVCADQTRCATSCSGGAGCRAGYECQGGACVVSEGHCSTNEECADRDASTIDLCIVVCTYFPRPGYTVDGDFDGDGIPNGSDKCPETFNTSQTDADNDGIWDACDPCVAPGTAEVCNGRDDDCDGVIDNGFGVGVACRVTDEPCRVAAVACVSEAAAECVAQETMLPDGALCGERDCSGGDLRLAARCDTAGRCKQGDVVSCGGFKCVASETFVGCPTSCVRSDDCVGDLYCHGGACEPRPALGEDCDGPEQCAEGTCVEGVCCESECTSPCYSCATEASRGTCVPAARDTDPGDHCGACELCDGAGGCEAVTAGTNPKNACVVDVGCGGTGLCDDDGQCGITEAGTGCADPICVGGVLSSGTTCDGIGGCLDVTTAPCPNGYDCADATSCRTDCSGDTHCADDYYCDLVAKICRRLVDPGVGCGNDRECATGYCADGVCCDEPCGGVCETCAGSAPGTCAPVEAGDDPARECGTCSVCDGARACAAVTAGDDPLAHCEVGAEPCGQTGACDGNGGCAVQDSGVPCSDAVCIDGTLIPSRECDGARRCEPTSGTSCGGFGCDEAGEGCRTSCDDDGHCVTGHTCDGNRNCVPKANDGAACDTGRECKSGRCTDNICCDRRCDGLCESCAIKDSEGVCSAVVNADDDDSCQGIFTCSGEGSCKLKPGERCGGNEDCAVGKCAVHDKVCCEASCDGPCDVCDGAGTCLSATQVQIGGRCDGDNWCDALGVCRPISATGCSGHGDCPDTHYCLGTSCVPKLGLGGVCDGAEECESGHCTDDVCCVSDCDASVCSSCGANGQCEPTPALRDPEGDCADDGKVCDGAGACKEPNGATCDDVAQCASGHCTDNTCCESACDGVCEACTDGTGVCEPLSNTTDDGTCEPPKVCVGRDSCVELQGNPCADGTECASGECVPTGILDLKVCCDRECVGECESCITEDQVGTCTMVTRGAIAGACDGANWCDASGKCVAIGSTSCGSAGDCPEGFVCDENSKCVAALGLGIECTLGEQCDSGHCIDDVCCDGPCGRKCESCKITNFHGTCTSHAPGSDPELECDAADTCNGASACKRIPGALCETDFDCAVGVCSRDGRCCDRACAGDCETCVDTDGVCAVVIDDVTDQCNDTRRCNPVGVCLRADGITCGTDEDCASNRCADNVCCDQPCNGQCETCAGTGGQCNGVFSSEAPGECDGLQWCDNGGQCNAKEGSSCAGGSPCPHGYFCDFGDVCTEERPLGDGCETSMQCRSGICSDGVCCDAPCDADCAACNMNGTTGRCLPVPVGDNPVGACEDGKACSATGICLQGTGEACSDETGAGCATGFCVDGVCCEGACGELCETCNGGDPGQCVGANGEEMGCDGAFACFAGRCLLANGERCADRGQCGSGLCELDGGGDSFCCPTNCGTACHSCKGGSCELVRGVVESFGCGMHDGQWCDHAGGCRAIEGSGCKEPGEPCPGGYLCSAGNCTAEKADGAQCDAGAECASGYCVSGKCCSTKCNGPCDVCDQVPGTCTLAEVGSDPNGTCGVADNACSADGTCRAANGTPCGANDEMCASGQCVDGHCCESACDGLCNTCALPGDKGKCHLVLGKDDPDSCTAPFTCSDTGQCLAGDGAACDDGGDCASTHCVDGVCCDRACDFGCEQCNGDEPGICTKLKRSFDPAFCPIPTSWCDDGGICTAVALSSCGGGLDCPEGYACPPGGGQCTQLANIGEECGTHDWKCESGFCADGFCCLEPCDGTCETCGAPSLEGRCAFAAPGEACGESASCDGLGQCKADEGVFCNNDFECVSGFCTDSRCCNEACDGVCMSCAQNGLEGKCTGVGGSPYETCGGPNVCAGYDQCVLKLGEDCVEGAECASGRCVDDVCCDTPCTDGCRACDLPTSKGTCTPLVREQEQTCQDPVWCGDASVCEPIAAASCFGDDDCPLNYICDQQTLLCAKLLQDGDPCDDPNECESKICAEGVCCDQICLGECETCIGDDNTTGTCHQADVGSNPHGSCSTGDVCGVDGTCGFANARACVTGGECASSNCVGFICCDTTCDGPCDECSSGTCTTLTNEDTTANCSGSYACYSDGCKLVDGEFCGGNSTLCGSGRCADDVCCNAVCGICQACNLTNPGLCEPLDLAEDDGCKGAAWCVAGICTAKDGQDCSVNACADGYHCNPDTDECIEKAPAGAACTGDAGCIDGNCHLPTMTCCSSPCSGACSECSTGTCLQITNGDSPSCSGTSSCDANGDCTLVLGQPCNVASECVFGFCEDNICCNTACAVTETCNAGGTCETQPCLVDIDCDPAAWCDYDTDHLCKVRGGLGSDCDDPRQCTFGLTCTLNKCAL